MAFKIIHLLQFQTLSQTNFNKYKKNTDTLSNEKILRIRRLCTLPFCLIQGKVSIKLFFFLDHACML